MTNTLTKTNKAKDQLLHDLHALVADAQQICKALKADTVETVHQLGRSAREKGNRIQTAALSKAKSADQAVRNNPYRTAGIAFAVGLVLTALLRKTKSKEAATSWNRERRKTPASLDMARTPV